MFNGVWPLPALLLLSATRLINRLRVSAQVCTHGCLYNGTISSIPIDSAWWTSSPAVEELVGKSGELVIGITGQCYPCMPGTTYFPNPQLGSFNIQCQGITSDGLGLCLPCGYPYTNTLSQLNSCKLYSSLPTEPRCSVGSSFGTAACFGDSYTVDGVANTGCYLCEPGTYASYGINCSTTHGYYGTCEPCPSPSLYSGIGAPECRDLVSNPCPAGHCTHDSGCYECMVGTFSSTNNSQCELSKDFKVYTSGVYGFCAPCPSYPEASGSLYGATSCFDTLTYEEPEETPVYHCPVNSCVTSQGEGEGEGEG
jgi:hypothetical protein